MSLYRILSMDGGGIRGIITAMLLEKLDASFPGFLSKIDLFAGTSTGGLLALGFAAGKSPKEAVQLYQDLGDQVFADTVLDDIRDLGTLIGADYNTEPLRSILINEFGSLTLGDLEKKVLVSAFDLDNYPDDPNEVRTWKAKFFHNFPGPDSDAHEKVVEIGLYTSAAPTYFPTVNGYIDGGVVANNPSVCALAQALHLPTGGQWIEDVVLLSVGTGHNPRYLDVSEEDWGLVQWAPLLVHLVLEGSAGLAHYQCQQLLGARYLRVNPILPVPIGMDRVDKIPVLKKAADQYDLTSAKNWLKRYFTD